MPDPNQNTNGLTSLPVPDYGGTSGGYNTGHTANGPGSNWRGNDPSWDPTTGGSDPTGGKMTVGQGNTYGNIYGQAGGMSQYFNNQAANYNQTSPTIGDQARLGTAADYYTGLMSGDAGYAGRQYQQSQDQNIAAQMAIANSTRGGAAAAAGAQRAVMQNVGALNATAANQAAQIAAGEEQQGAQGLQGIGTLDLQRAQANANLQQNNQQQINQMQQSLLGMGEQEQGLGLSAQQAYMANLLAAEGQNAQQSQFNTNLGMQIGGTALQTAGTIGGVAASDANLKTGIQSAGGVGSGGLTSAYGTQPSANPLAPSGGLTSQYSHALNTQPQAQLPDTKGDAAKGAGVGAASGLASGAASGGPVGALLGAAGGAATGGLGAAAHDNPHDQELKIGNTAAQTGIGAASGAAAGAAFGGVGAPIGALIGGGIGLIKGLMT